MAPYQSEAQRKFFHTKTAKDKGITEDEVNEFDKASKGMKSPAKKVSEKSPLFKALGMKGK